jgi:hypothetical protein
MPEEEDKEGRDSSSSDSDSPIPPAVISRNRKRKAANYFDECLLSAVDKASSSTFAAKEAGPSAVSRAIRDIRARFSKDAQVWAAVLFSKQVDVASIYLDLDEDVRADFLAAMLERPVSDLI